MNLANKITLMRMILVPFFMFTVLVDFPYHMLIATIVFLIAASTDKLDGYVAKKRNEITNFGKFMDPLADKLLITSALVTLVQMGKVPAVVAVIILSREFIITGFRTLAACYGIVMAASWWGKIKTVTQIIAITAILLDNIPFKWIGFPFDQVALYISLFATVISGIDYIYKNKQVLSQK